MSCFSYIKSTEESDDLLTKGGTQMEFQIKTKKGNEISFKVSDSVAKAIGQAMVNAFFTAITSVLMKIFM